MNSIWIVTWNQLGEIEAMLRGILKDSEAEHLNARELHVLGALYERDGQRASDLAIQIGSKPTSFTPVLDNLQAAELIRRKTTDKDRRVVTIHLTEDGEALRTVVQTALDEINDWFDALDYTPNLSVDPAVKNLLSVAHD